MLLKLCWLLNASFFYFYGITFLLLFISVLSFLSVPSNAYQLYPLVLFAFHVLAVIVRSAAKVCTWRVLQKY